MKITRLPESLMKALELTSSPSRELRQAAENLSERYRSDAPGPYIRNQLDAQAYAAMLLPATFAQVQGALAQIKARQPEWAPKSLLDLGSGPGTAMWAAAELWPDLGTFTAMERSPEFLSMGQSLAAQSACAGLRRSDWRSGDLTKNALPRGRFDLVILAHVVSELPPGERESIVRGAWAATAGTLLVIEPGTPAGFSVVRRARERLFRWGGQTIAPCPHGDDCPLPSNDWCHFPQRLERPPTQRVVKEATLAWEDAKYSFIAVTRQPNPPGAWARIIRTPRRGKGIARIALCGPTGLENRTVSKRDREAWRRARKAQWGDALPPSSTAPSSPASPPADFDSTGSAST